MLIPKVVLMDNTDYFYLKYQENAGNKNTTTLPEGG